MNLFSLVYEFRWNMMPCSTLKYIFWSQLEILYSVLQKIISFRSLNVTFFIICMNKGCYLIRMTSKFVTPPVFLTNTCTSEGASLSIIIGNNHIFSLSNKLLVIFQFICLFWICWETCVVNNACRLLCNI